MDEVRFWSLVHESKGNAAKLAKRLAREPVSEIVAFDDELDRLLSKSYQGELWCVAYVAMGGCSDDAFDYFRAWLVGRGRAVFEAALASPDSLHDELVAMRERGEGDIPQDEDFLAVAADAYGKKTGKREAFYDVPRAAAAPRPGLSLAWREEEPETMRAVCPRVFETFFDDPL